MKLCMFLIFFISFLGSFELFSSPPPQSMNFASLSSWKHVKETDSKSNNEDNDLTQDCWLQIPAGTYSTLDFAEWLMKCQCNINACQQAQEKASSDAAWAMQYKYPELQPGTAEYDAQYQDLYNMYYEQANTSEHFYDQCMQSTLSNLMYLEQTLTDVFGLSFPSSAEITVSHPTDTSNQLDTTTTQPLPVPESIQSANPCMPGELPVGTKISVTIDADGSKIIKFTIPNLEYSYMTSE